jgi:hypothetical protein
MFVARGFQVGISFDDIYLGQQIGDRPLIV